MLRSGHEWIGRQVFFRRRSGRQMHGGELHMYFLVNSSALTAGNPTGDGARSIWHRHWVVSLTQGLRCSTLHHGNFYPFFMCSLV